MLSLHLCTCGISNICTIMYTHLVFGSECYGHVRAYFGICMEATCFNLLLEHTVGTYMHNSGALYAYVAIV